VFAACYCQWVVDQNATAAVRVRVERIAAGAIRQDIGEQAIAECMVKISTSTLGKPGDYARCEHRSTRSLIAPLTGGGLASAANRLDLVCRESNVQHRDRLLTPS
jgi:hypothetical protein